MLHGHLPGRIVHRAIPVVIVANGAVEHVISENPIERFPLCGYGFAGFRRDIHCGNGFGCSRARQLAIHFNHAGVTALNGTELRMIADLGKLCPDTIYEIDEALLGFRFGNRTING